MEQSHFYFHKQKNKNPSWKLPSKLPKKIILKHSKTQSSCILICSVIGWRDASTVVKFRCGYCQAHRLWACYLHLWSIYPYINSREACNRLNLCRDLFAFGLLLVCNWMLPLLFVCPWASLILGEGPMVTRGSRESRGWRRRRGGGSGWAMGERIVIMWCWINFWRARPKCCSELKLV